MESDAEDYFDSFMKVQSKFDFLASKPSTSNERLLILQEKENDDVVPIRGSRVSKPRKAKANRVANKPTVTKKTKKATAQSQVLEEVNNDVKVEKTKPRRGRQLRRRHLPEEVQVSDDDDDENPQLESNIASKRLHRREDEVVTVASSSSSVEEKYVNDLRNKVNQLSPIPESQGLLEENVERCNCCNLKKQYCRINSNTTKNPNILLKSLKELKEFNEKAERSVIQQQKNLLNHPEMDSLCSSISDVPPTSFLSKSKEKWIWAYFDSMMVDRVDYEKPIQVNNVQGLDHSTVDTDTPVSSEDDHLTDSVTILKRIDFEKEKKTRLSMLLEKQTSVLNQELATPSFSKKQVMVTSTPIDLPNQELATPSFSRNHMVVTSTPLVGEGSCLPKNDEPCDDDFDLSKLDYSNVTLRTPLKSINKEDENNLVESVGEKQSGIEILNQDQTTSTVANTDVIQSNVPESTSRYSYIPRSLRQTSSVLNEEQVMNFVDNLVGAQEEILEQEANNNFNRIMRVGITDDRASQNNVINLVDDVFVNAVNIDDSVMIVDDDSNDAIEIVENSTPIVIDDAISIYEPTTSNRKSKRKSESNRPISRKKMKLELSPVVFDAYTSSTKASKKLMDCPICLESLDNKEISSTFCGHIFCTPCIKKAIKQTRKCPNCRKGLTLKKIHLLYL